MSALSLFTRKKVSSQEEHWVPLADLMTGLMMVFMLIAILFMMKVEQDSEKIKASAEKVEVESAKLKAIAILYNEMRERLYIDLQNEFQKDLPKWKAHLDRDLTIRFEEPEVLFDTGRFALKAQFTRILDDFFPRYIRILSNTSYRDAIEEIRIEGHTSSVWSVRSGADEAYFKNMELSQARTRATLEYALVLPQVGDQKKWLTGRLTANGLSSSRLRLNADNSENREASQRVEFRVRTNAEARIGEILSVVQR